jgi:hypothetical protein
MADSAQPALDLSAVPLFPLPNIVLFPRAILPLHIFEERYKQMTADVLEGERLIAMALLKRGWEQNYYQQPAIEPIVCVGTIVSHERLADGNYNFLLQGHTRAKVVREFGDKGYRLAELEVLEEMPIDESDLLPARRRLISIFDQGTLLATDLGRHFRQLLATPFPTSAIADLIAFKLLDEVPLKQSLLADCNVHRRVHQIVEALEAARPVLEPAPLELSKPSLN